MIAFTIGGFLLYANELVKNSVDSCEHRFPPFEHRITDVDSIKQEINIDEWVLIVRVCNLASVQTTVRVPEDVWNDVHVAVMKIRQNGRKILIADWVIEAYREKLERERNGNGKRH